MDEETVRQLEAEIKELNTFEGYDGNVDDIDGFVKSVKKQLEKISGKSFQKSEETSSTDAATGSSSRKDFQENKTSFIAQETQHRGQGDSDDIYDFTHENRGLAIVINNEDFEADSKFGARPGSSYDATALYQTFKKLGFKVLVKNNLTAEQMVELLKLAKDSYDHGNADCFVCSILTHGDETIAKNEDIGSTVRQDILFGVDGIAVYTKTIVGLFSDHYCPGLKGKPRLFFFQACRGAGYDHGVDIEVARPVQTPGCFGGKMPDQPDSRSSGVDQPDSSASKRQTSFSSSVDPPEFDQRLRDSTDAKPVGVRELRNEFQGDSSSPGFKQPGAFGGVTNAYKSEQQLRPLRDVPVIPTPLYKDCLVMYATPPGHYAWRRKNGAWFIQSLCEVLNSPQIAAVSLLNALVQVTRKVANHYQSENPTRQDMHHKKETPVIESMLVKDIYLT